MTSAPGGETDPVLTHNREALRFELRVGDEIAGVASYRVTDDAYVMDHTETAPHLGGRGLGGRLVGFALDTLRADGRAVIPACSFVSAYIRRHPDYADLVPADQRTRYGLAGGRRAAPGSSSSEP
jgi:predicted GNAT family acetyltransferase